MCVPQKLETELLQDLAPCLGCLHKGEAIHMSNRSQQKLVDGSMIRKESSYRVNLRFHHQISG